MTENLPVPEGGNFFSELGKSLPAPTEEDMAVLEEAKEKGTQEAMKGLALEWPRVNLLHQGTAQFQFQQGEKVVRTFKALIVHIEPNRVYWKDPIGTGEGKNFPDCFSRNLEEPEPLPEDAQPISPKCASCPMNQWGSDVDKEGNARRGKACKEVRRIFFVPEGHLLAHVMTIPPTSLKPLRSYLSALTDKKVSVNTVLTEFKLNNVENREGITYSELALSRGEKLDDSVAAYLLKFKKEILAALAYATPVTKDEYVGGGQTGDS